MSRAPRPEREAPGGRLCVAEGLLVLLRRKPELHVFHSKALVPKTPGLGLVTVEPKGPSEEPIL